jgi:hypothetical protein
MKGKVAGFLGGTALHFYISQSVSIFCRQFATGVDV